ncbi:MAG: TonB-dependent receptor, partial [Novosphingobium sp.]|nr:TonB-dependent receptor [Novosphingobium sp.]
MNKMKGYLTASMVALAAATAAPAYASDEAAEQGGSQASQGLSGETIVVTARRREEKLADVPVAVTALGEDQLKAAQVVTPKELSNFVPSLNVNTGNTREGNRFTLRGQGATLAAGEAVVTYLADAPVPYLGAGAAGMYFDLASVQVLNGPQGTLFGRNTTGGAVLFTPRKPADENSGYIEFGYGNYNNREMSGALNVALVPDKLLIRVAGTWRKRDGYTTNVHDGKKLDNTDYYGIRASVIARPTDWLENYLVLQLSESNNNGTGFFIEDVNPDFPYFQSQLQAGLAKQKTLKPREVDNNSVFFLAKTAALINTTTVSFNDHLRLKNIFSYMGNRSKNGFDIDGTGLEAVVTYYDHPWAANTSANGLSNEKYLTNELQLSGESLDGKLTWVAGAFYLDYKPKGYSAQDYTLFGVRRIQEQWEAGTSKALYAQFTADLGMLTPALDNLKFTAGYRYTWDKKRALNNLYNANTGACLNKSSGSYPDCEIYYSDKWKQGTYTLGLDYKVTPDVLVYATTRRGYKAGGFNVNSDPSGIFADYIAFGPESITDYEVGLKAAWHVSDVRMNTTLAAFTANYDDIQRTQTVSVPPKNPGDAPSVTNLVVNAATAKISGIELQQTLRAGGLTLDGSFSYLDAHYKKFVLPDGTDRSGITLPYSPKYKFSGSIAYAASLGKVGEGMARISYAYSSKSRYNDPDQPGNYMGGYGLWNFDASIKEVAGTPLELDFFVTNLTNKRVV